MCKKRDEALTRVVQWAGRPPTKRKSLVGFPVWAQAQVVGSVPGRGECKRQPIDVSLPPFPSL